jgi:hypothetical protein
MPEKTTKKSTKPASPSISSDVGELRCAAIEARLAALESMSTSAGNASSLDAQAHEPASRAKFRTGKPRKFWALEHIQQHSPETGATIFAGQVTLPTNETYAWQVEAPLDSLLAADWMTAHTRMSALAHPVRLKILKALLVGQRDTQSLQALPDMGTTGQLYHHLKELESAGWIRQPRRGEYMVLAERVVPLLTILSACEVK